MIIQRIKRKYRNLFLREPFRKKAPTVQEQTLINELREGFLAIEIINTDTLTGSTKEWGENINRLRQFVINCDPRCFLQWDVIRNTMFVDNPPYVLKELDTIRNSRNFNKYWGKGIVETKFGFPTTEGNLMNSSGNLIHHAYHLLQFEAKTKIEISTIDFVFEFGGGYGSMCRLFKNLNNNNKYLLFDLPEFSLLQKYYLKSLGYNVLTLAEFSNSESGILCLSDFEELTVILKSVNPSKRNLFIGTWSISESPVDLRNSVFQLLKNFKLFLIAYQYGFFCEVNNVEYLKNVQNEYSHIKWENYLIEHLPGNNYLIGSGL